MIHDGTCFMMEHVSTGWNMMEFDGIIMMEHDGTRWNLMEFDGS
jgi:hypothetical protein